MNTWYEVKVKYTKMLDNGAFKRVTEPYLFAAMTHSDAETRCYEELGSLVRGEFLIVGIKPVNFHDIFHYEDSDTWYKVKIQYFGGSEDSEKPKKITQLFLLSAHSVANTSERLIESLDTMMIDFTIPSVMISPVVDVFPYEDKIETDIDNSDIHFNDEEDILP